MTQLMKKTVLLCACLLMLTCSDDKGTDRDEARLVKTMVLKPTTEKAVRIFPGRVIASNKVDLGFLVNGQIIEFPVVNGQVVQKDQLLARLDPRDYQHRVDGEAAELLKAELNYERAKELVRTGTIAVSTYDDRKSRYEVAKAKTATAQKALDDTNLRAPFSGLVANTYVENYQNVRAKENILSLQDINHIDITIDLPETDMMKVEAIRRGEDLHGKEIDHVVVFESVPGKEFQVSIKEYETEADPVTQTYKVTFTMPAPEGLNILPGMTANFVVEPKVKEGEVESYLVPASALVTAPDEKRFVWVVNQETMEVHEREVTLGEATGKSVRVLTGVKKGEHVVTAGVNYLEEGMKVREYVKP